MEIAFLGDTMNTAARLQQAGRDTGQRVLASAALVNGLAALPPGIAKHSIGRCVCAARKTNRALRAYRRSISDPCQRRGHGLVLSNRLRLRGLQGSAQVCSGSIPLNTSGSNRVGARALVRSGGRNVRFVLRLAACSALVSVSPAFGGFGRLLRGGTHHGHRSVLVVGAGRA